MTVYFDWFDEPLVGDRFQGCRGFVCQDGSVFAWPLVAAEHSDYHRIRGTSDAEFQTRWRKWGAGSPVEVDSGDPKHLAAVESYLERYLAGEEVPRWYGDDGTEEL